MLDFQERMAGPVTFGCSDALVAAQLGDSRGEEMTLRLTVTIDELDAFLADYQHRATVTGFVDCDILGGEMRIEHGSLALLPETETGRATTMEYRLDCSDLTGRELTLVGVKTVRNDPGLDLWRDATTLDVQLFLRQHDLSSSRPDALGTSVLSGQLRLSLRSFLHQLTTFHATVTGSLGWARTVGAFGAFVLRRLVDVYLGPCDAVRVSAQRVAGTTAVSAPRGTGHAVSEFAGWPGSGLPESAYVFAHNERIVAAPPERVWDELVTIQGWSEFYANARFVKLTDPQQHRLQRGSVFRWVTFGLPLTSEVDLCEPSGRIGWRWWARWWGTGAHGYHVWLLEPHERGTRIVTEEIQLGILMWLGRPIMQRLLPLGHNLWLRRLGRRATSSPRSAGARGSAP